MTRFLIVLLLLTAACTAPAPTRTPVASTPTATSVPDVTLTPTHTPTAAPPPIKSVIPYIPNFTTASLVTDGCKRHTSVVMIGDSPWIVYRNAEYGECVRDTTAAQNGAELLAVYDRYEAG